MRKKQGYLEPGWKWRTLVHVSKDEQACVPHWLLGMSCRHLQFGGTQAYGFSSSHVWMWELGHEEGWVPKNWCFRTVVLKKTLESPLDCKHIKPVNPKGNKPWIFIGGTDAEAPILWSLALKIWLTGKDPDAGKDWGQEEKGMTED